MATCIPLSFPLGMSLSDLQGAPTVVGEERGGMSELSRTAWHAADSFTAFTGNGIKSLPSYQRGSLASCRKSHILGGTEVEPERHRVQAAVLLRPGCVLRHP